MPDTKTQILIELQLEIKKMQAQFKDATKSYTDFKKALDKGTPEFKKSSKEQEKAIQDVSKSFENASKEAVKAEKKRQDAIKKTISLLEELKTVTKDVSKISAAGIGAGAGAGRRGPFKSFLGGMLGGAGLGGLAKPITAGGIGSSLGGGLSGLAGGLLGFITSGIAGVYQKSMQFGAAQSALTGLASRKEVKGGVRAGVGMGYTPMETVQHQIALAKTTGAAAAASRAQQISRYTGMDVGQVGGYMGMIRQAGYGFGGQTKYGQAGREGTKELTKAIEAGMISGLEKGRLPEFLQGVSQITQQIGGRVAGKVDVGSISRFMGFMGAGGRKGFEGFRGARGAAVAAQLNMAIQRPGGGEAGQAMMLQALGFGKPGGTTPYYQALKQQQMGISGDKNNAIKLFREVYSQLGRVGVGGSAAVNQEANLALGEMTGLGLDQVEKLGDLINSGEISNEEMKEIKEILKETKDPQKEALAVMKKGFMSAKMHIARVEEAQIAMGKTVEPYLKELEKLQLRALKFFINQIPKAIKWLSEMWSGIREISEWFKETWGIGKKDKEVEIQKKIFKEQMQLMGTEGFLGKSSEEIQKMLAGKSFEQKAKIYEEFSKFTKEWSKKFGVLSQKPAGFIDSLTGGSGADIKAMKEAIKIGSGHIAVSPMVQAYRKVAAISGGGLTGLTKSQQKKFQEAVNVYQKTGDIPKELRQQLQKIQLRKPKKSMEENLEELRKKRAGKKSKISITKGRKGGRKTTRTSRKTATKHIAPANHKPLGSTNIFQASTGVQPSIPVEGGLDFEGPLNLEGPFDVSEYLKE